MGKLEQGDLYASDDGMVKPDIELSIEEIPKDVKLDLGMGPQAPKISASSFLAKLKKPNEDKDLLAKQI